MPFSAQDQYNNPSPSYCPTHKSGRHTGELTVSRRGQKTSETSDQRAVRMTIVRLELLPTAYRHIHHDSTVSKPDNLYVTKQVGFRYQCAVYGPINPHPVPTECP